MWRLEQSLVFSLRAFCKHFSFVAAPMLGLRPWVRWRCTAEAELASLVALALDGKVIQTPLSIFH